MENLTGKIVKVEVFIDNDNSHIFEGIYYGNQFYDSDQGKVLSGYYFEGRLRGLSNDLQIINLKSLKYQFKVSPTKTDLDFSSLLRKRFLTNSSKIKRLNSKIKLNTKEEIKECLLDYEPTDFLRVSTNTNKYLFLNIDNNSYINMYKKSAVETKTYLIEKDGLESILISAKQIDIISKGKIKNPRNVILKMKFLFNIFGYFSLNKENLDNISKKELKSIQEAYLKIIDLDTLFENTIDTFEYFYWMFDKTSIEQNIDSKNSDFYNTIYFRNNKNKNYELIFFLPKDIIVENRLQLIVVSINGSGDLEVKTRIPENNDNCLIAINIDSIREINTSGLIRIPSDLVELFDSIKVIKHNYKELLNNNLLFEENYNKIIERKPIVIT